MIRWVEARMDMVDILQDIIIIRQETIGNKVGLNFHFYDYGGAYVPSCIRVGVLKIFGRKCFFLF